MAVTVLTTKMAGAINYTYTTDTSADWASVPNSTYFYDKADKLVHYKDSTGAVQEIFSAGGLTVGTTSVTSGTVGCIFFQGSGDVVQQDSTLFWDNTNKRLGVGATPSTSVRLDVRAQGASSTDIAFRVRNSADTNNILTASGIGTVWSNGAGFVQSNTAYGEEALDANTTGFWNTAFGYKALTADNTGVQNTAFGYQAAQSLTTANQTTAIGSGVLENVTTSGGNTGVGFWALRVTTSSENTAVGTSSMSSNTNGTRNVALGFASMTSNSGGSDNVIAGWYAGGLLTSGSSNVFLGMQAGYFFGAGSNLTSASDSIFIGQDTRPAANSQSNQIVIGHTAKGLGSNTAVIGNTSTTLFRPYGNVAIGADTAGARLDVRAQGALSTDIAFRVRNSADTANIVQINGDSSISIGSSSTGTTSSGYPYISFGVSANSSDRGISIGTNAGKNQNNSNLQNIFIGHDTGGGASTITGAMNIGIGSGVLRSLTSGTENIAIGGSTFGSQAGSVITSGSQNILIGRSSGYQVTTGNLNTAVGYFSATGITSGIQNTQIGGNVNSSINSSRVTAIGNQLSAGHSGAIMIGSAANTSGSCQSLTADALHVFFGVGDNNQSFYVNNNTNVVLKSHVALTSGTDFEAAATNTITIHNGTAPVANIADAYAQYSADITAGNAAPHFRTEAGDIIKLYKETTGVASATRVAGGGNTVTDTDTFNGYTIPQLVKALQNLGVLA